jgi:hypothetical protein
MPRRIDVELTSERPDGTWTWRAAGAREPKGELEASILPSGVKVGDVVRADADFNIEGIEILAIIPTKDERRLPDRIEVLGPQREFTPVTSQLASKGDRRPRGDRPDRGDRPSRGREGRDGRDDRPRTPRPSTPRADRPPRRERPAPPAPKPKPKKLRPARTHRDALLAGLSPEQQPVAEQLLRGGMPQVRTALEESNTAAAAEGRPALPTETILSIAEDLLPRTRLADWLDRAEAAKADAEEIALRDLRAVVSAADDVAREDATRELAAELKAVLDRRSSSEQQEWLTDVTSSLQGGRVVRALRLSSRPPQPTETLPEETLTALSDAAAAAMTADIAPDRWATLLDAVAYSPVRRTVVPAGAPAEPGEELLALVKKHAGRVPTVAKLFGIEAPAPASKRAPKPRQKPVPAKVSRPPLPPGPGGERRIPPPPRPIGAPETETTEAAPAPETAAREAPAAAATTETDAVPLPVEQEAFLEEHAAGIEEAPLAEEAAPTTTPEPAPAAPSDAAPATPEPAAVAQPLPVEQEAFLEEHAAGLDDGDAAAPTSAEG